MDERPTFRSCSVALRGAGGMGGSQRSNSHYSTATKVLSPSLLDPFGVDPLF